ncbi:aldo/keto reductase [Roseibacillus ishigakijimensis]|uniref:Aldo/keto reductase n=1 Tax=Roseibacillus ishigakijimensis TaxID=454146 RepID=A0A934RSL2_9BACT|nr:aldo/keto reductase [Roseibacillus ishigakijimensis]MBK1835167.1 aldo/keto reductase [Roseibacillus ishigakijimensis]
MTLTTLGQTGLQVSPLCIGTWQLAGPLNFDGQPDGHPDPGKEAALRLIHELGDRGLNFIDTAEQYGDGEAERRTGEALKGQRDQWVISTKFGYRVGPGVTRIDDSSPPTILPSLEGSLQRLQTDVIDIYLYHCAPEPAHLEEAFEILEGAREAGKVRFFGISTSDLELSQALYREGLLDVLQFPSNLLSPARELSTFCEQNDIGTQVRGVLAQGRLSGKYFAGQPQWDGNDNRTHRLAGDDLSRYAVLAEDLPEGYTMAQAAIRWVLDQPAHDSICLGAKSLADYEAALAALELPPLGADFFRSLEEKAAALA